MCGIALIIGPNPNATVFERMLDAIAPRGDVQETLSGDGYHLGTQRLKIVDRERAIQPWSSPDGRWAVCYNGEVYNFRSLRSELAAVGHELRSDSDTEVILEAFLEWGNRRCIACVASSRSPWLTGLWTGSIWLVTRSALNRSTGLASAATYT